MSDFSPPGLSSPISWLTPLARLISDVWPHIDLIDPWPPGLLTDWPDLVSYEWLLPSRPVLSHFLADPVRLTPDPWPLTSYWPAWPVTWHWPDLVSNEWVFPSRRLFPHLLTDSVSETDRWPLTSRSCLTCDLTLTCLTSDPRPTWFDIQWSPPGLSSPIIWLTLLARLIADPWTHIDLSDPWPPRLLTCLTLDLAVTCLTSDLKLTWFDIQWVSDPLQACPPHLLTDSVSETDPWPLTSHCLAWPLTSRTADWLTCDLKLTWFDIQWVTAPLQACPLPSPGWPG